MNHQAAIIRTVALAAACVAGFAAVTPASAESKTPIVVSDANALQRAVASAHVGDRILVRPGEYRIARTLVVPDGVSVEGSGVMQGGGLPTGFEPGTETAIVALPRLTGDTVTLSNGASLRALIVRQDVNDHSGNAVSVGSRRPSDSVSATIVECEIVNPNEQSGGPDGPTGGGIAVLTRNRGGAAAPAPDEGAEVTLSMRRSIVHSPGDVPAVFAINSARNGRIGLRLDRNVIGGRLDAAGGVSRGDLVTGATLTIDSTGNLYAPETASPGWTIVGGSSPPNPAIGTTGASSNTVRIGSTGDRIDGAPVGIQAFGGQRIGTEFGPSSDNRVQLVIAGLTLRTVAADEPASDFVLAGAASFCFCESSERPGDRNVVRVSLRDSTGSGPRDNVYENVLGPTLPRNFGTGNRLEFAGTPAAFAASNHDIDPAPDARFFVG